MAKLKSNIQNLLQRTFMLDERLNDCKPYESI
jgi:hypothetical protein